MPWKVHVTCVRPGSPPTDEQIGQLLRSCLAECRGACPEPAGVARDATQPF